jgi:hypothetical protein
MDYRARCHDARSGWYALRLPHSLAGVSKCLLKSHTHMVQVHITGLSPKVEGGLKRPTKTHVHLLVAEPPRGMQILLFR